MADEELDLSVPSCLYLVSAFLAMEPPEVLISLARVCGGGSVTDRVQSFIWDHCISKADGKCHAPYLKSFLKKLILDVESRGSEVLDKLYEKYAFYMTSLKDDDVAKGNSRVLKCISFLFPKNGLEGPSCPKLMNLEVPLQCSLNMLEGDTGCCIWPSSLYLSEFILSCPEIFSNKSCFEVGSGVGLVGICLAHVKASKVILSDGDLSSLANMKLNLELNQLRTRTDFPERATQNPNTVQSIYLPWESALETELQDSVVDIILGADVIYDPLCLPHLIRVLAAVLSREKSYSDRWNDSCLGFPQVGGLVSNEVHGAGYTNGLDGKKTPHNNGLKRSVSDDDDDKHASDADQGKAKCNGAPDAENLFHAAKVGPVAYIASVIRNIDTFNYFLALADQANLTVTDITENVKLFDLLPYMRSYQQSSVRLFTVTYLCK
ncbi:hypothetical protein F0562_019825 [Nyssa sinensis]|uniref:Uncharacterized protein n=1 Tax=Nyssa sinensis TaxID=561372 RepID=A0A5J5BR56_9ASTE|nr:hypothetical protein F0562_019825 [Nyssa sinensis]